MRILHYIIIFLFCISIDSIGQESTSETEIYIYHSPVPRFNENKFIKEIEDLYSDCNESATFYLIIYIDNLGEPSRIQTNDSLRKIALLELVRKNNDWIAGRKNFKFTETENRYKISCEKNGVKVKSLSHKSRLKKYEIRHFDFHKGINLGSTERIKPFDSFSINNYIKDSLGLDVLEANRYRAKSRDNSIKTTIDSKLFKSDSFILMYLKNENKLIRVKKEQNYIYLPANSDIDFLAIRRNKSLIIQESLILTKDTILANLWVESSYDELRKIFKSW